MRVINFEKIRTGLVRFFTVLQMHPWELPAAAEAFDVGRRDQSFVPVASCIIYPWIYGRSMSGQSCDRNLFWH